MYICFGIFFNNLEKKALNHAYELYPISLSWNEELFWFPITCWKTIVNVHLTSTLHIPVKSYCYAIPCIHTASPLNLTTEDWMWCAQKLNAHHYYSMFSINKLITPIFIKAQLKEDVFSACFLSMLCKASRVLKSKHMGVFRQNKLVSYVQCMQ